MNAAILTAFSFLLVLLLEGSLIATLPKPWYALVLPLIVGTVIMYRTSLPLGVCFLILSSFITFERGLTHFDAVIASLVAGSAAVVFSSRVFARRSLFALSGFAFGMTLTYFGTLLVVAISVAVIKGQVFSVRYSLLEIVLLLLAHILGVIVLSLLLTTLKAMLGKRFMRRDTSYEVQTRI